MQAGFPGDGKYGNFCIIRTEVSNVLAIGAPAEGNFQALIQTPPMAGTVSQSTLETFLGLNSGSLNSLQSGGGPNYGGVAIDPQAGYVFVNARNVAGMGRLDKTKEGDGVAYRRFSPLGAVHSD